MGDLAGVGGAADAVIDHQARRILFHAPLRRGGESTTTVRVLAPRDSGGDSLSLAVWVLHGQTMTEWRHHADVTIDTRPARGGLSLGSVRVTPAGLVVLAVLFCGAALWAGLHMTSGGRGHAGQAAVALTLAAGFWAMFAAMAWRDYRSLTAWPETSCTVLGGRLSAQGVSRSRAPGVMPRQDDTLFAPELSLRYRVGGAEMYSTGFDTGSRLGRGPRGGRTGELERWEIGAAVPCWYDPDDPADVVVLRGFGGAYLFALFPLPIFIAGLTLARRR